MIRNLKCLSLALCTACTVGCAGSPPDYLGVRDGRLAPCPDSPNCVSSQALADSQRIAPLTYPGSSVAAFETLIDILEGDPAVRIVEARDGYIHAEFRSRLMGFVDDAEFWWQQPGRAIEVRSASRLGYADFGVNRDRIERLRTMLQEKSPAVAK